LSAAFAAITAGAVFGLGENADRNALLAFRRLDDPSRLVGAEWLSETARNLTSIGSFTLLSVVVTVATVSFIILKKTTAARHILVAFVGGIILLNISKWSIARPRPDLVVPLSNVFTTSFPSGHAALSATTYFTLAAILSQLIADRRLNAFVVFVSFVLVLIAGLSRVYLGVHYPSDVLAGWCLGSAWALFCGLIMNRGHWKERASSLDAAQRGRNVG
jgi:undecaprenyl-diphosphatase